MVPRILIADDHEAVLRAIRTVLECDSRFEVCGSVTNGADALIRAQELHPDVIILDLAMPVMNGFETARKIAAILPDIPIVMYTLTDSPQVRLEAAHAGIREVVAKSAGAPLLIGALENALRKEVAVTPGGGGSGLPLAIAALDATGGSREPQPADSSNTDPIKPS
jgi:DNA-binding NarL/FixJ family response regulator